MCFTDRKSILQRIVCCVSHWRELARTYITKQKLCSNSRHCLQWFVYLNMPLNIKDCVLIYIQIDLAFLYSNFVSGTHFLHKLYMYTRKGENLSLECRVWKAAVIAFPQLHIKIGSLGLLYFLWAWAEARSLSSFSVGQGEKNTPEIEVFFFFFLESRMIQIWKFITVGLEFTQQENKVNSLQERSNCIFACSDLQLQQESKGYLHSC